MAFIKKKASASKSKNAGSRRIDSHQITAIIMFFVNVLLFAIAIVPGVNIWNAIHNLMLGLCGFWVFPWLIFSGYILGIAACDRIVGKGLQLIGVGLLMLFFTTLIGVFSYDISYVTYGEFLSAAYENGIIGTGIVGSIFAYPLTIWFGKMGAVIILVLAILVLVLLLTDTTLRQFFTTVSKPVQTITETTKVAIADRRKHREEKEWDISLEGMPDEPINPIKPSEEDLETQGRHLAAKYHEEQEMKENPASEEADTVTDNQSEVELDDIIRRAQTDMDALRPGKATQTDEDKAEADEQTASMAVEEIQEEVNQPEEYRYPPVSLLEQNFNSTTGGTSDELKNNAALLVDTLRSFGVETRIINISRGPSVTRYELQPAAGVKVAKIKNLADDIALNLATTGVRIEAPIPNKAAVGIEVPNKAVASVRLRDIIDTYTFDNAKSKMTVAVGEDVTGNIITGDLAKMPHLLIAGTTGSGKSVCISSFILSVLYKASPADVKLLMIDPKVVEFEVYNGLPHLLVPVVSDAKKASGALGWAVAEMEKRYKLFGECKVRDLASYNQFAENNDGYEHMPQILIVVDELADLMMVAPAEVEDSICRLAQKARAAGMHLVVATQRPSADVITGLIKANIPSRISLKVANAMESRIILDTPGAEKLLGKGDMLFYPVGSPKPLRVQGCWVSDEEIKEVVNYIIGDQVCEYSQEISEEIEKHVVESKGKKSISAEGDDDTEGDEMIPQAMEVVVEAGLASTSLLQRKLKLGYARAARIVDQLEERGIVGPFEGAKPRKVLISKQQYEEMRMNQSE